jgi:hypothetical protein
MGREHGNEPPKKRPAKNNEDEKEGELNVSYEPNGETNVAIAKGNTIAARVDGEEIVPSAPVPIRRSGSGQNTLRSLTVEGNYNNDQINRNETNEIGPLGPRQLSRYLDIQNPSSHVSDNIREHHEIPRFEDGKQEEDNLSLQSSHNENISFYYPRQNSHPLHPNGISIEINDQGQIQNSFGLHTNYDDY